MLEQMANIAKIIGIIPMFYYSYRYICTWWTERKAGKIGRLNQVIREIELMEATPGRLPASLGEVKAALMWVLLGMALEVAILVGSTREALWQELVIGFIIFLMVVVFFALLQLYVRMCQRHRNPVKYTALYEARIGMLRLKEYESTLQKENRTLTTDDLTIQIIPCRVLKSDKKHGRSG